jgi:putative transposase
MPRKARVEFPGAVYHVLDRGDRREAIFRDEADRVRFVETLGEVCARTGWRVHAYVLMSNHYHWLLETPEPNLVAGMRWFQSTWTLRFNRRRRLCGHLFQGRYKAVVVDPEERGYFATLSDYIHLNPVRARLVGLEDRLVDYRWSSYPLYARTAGRPGWFEPQTVLAELGMADTPEGRRQYAHRMRGEAVATLRGEKETALGELREGWCLGGESFRERVLGLLDVAGEKWRGRREVDAAVRHTHDEAEARRLIGVGLSVFGLSPESLAELPKGDVRKLALARMIRARTAVPNAWLAHALGLGHASRLNHRRSKWEGAIREAASKLETGAIF